MKVLIMSDSHGLTHEISIIKESHKHDVAKMIHCGDSELAKSDPNMSELIQYGEIVTVIQPIRIQL